MKEHIKFKYYWDWGDIGVCLRFVYAPTDYKFLVELQILFFNLFIDIYKI